jgi:hypothetical protein
MTTEVRTFKGCRTGCLIVVLLCLLFWALVALLVWVLL